MELTKHQISSLQQVLAVCANSDNIEISTHSDDGDVIISQVNELHTTNIVVCYNGQIIISFISKKNTSNNKLSVLHNELDLVVQIKPFIS